MVSVANTHREVQRGNLMVFAAQTDLGRAAYPVVHCDLERGHIRVRRAQPPSVSDRDRQHTRHLTGEGDHPGVSGTDGGSDRGGDVDAPMSAVRPDGLKRARHLARYRHLQSGTWRDGGNQNGREQD